MAMTEATSNNIHSFFEKLESQKSLLSQCADTYKTLTSHFTNLQQSINFKTLTLDSKLQSLHSLYQTSLDELHQREASLPAILQSLSSEVASKRDSAIAELDKPVDESAPLSEVLKLLCRRMDCSHLMRYVVCKRKETVSLRVMMREAMKECVDPARMVLEAVREYLGEKEGGVRGMADKRWACGVVVSGLFPVEELKEKRKQRRSFGVEFARKTMEEAEEVVRDWREKGEKVGGGAEFGGSGMGSAEAAMFLQVVVGFGLKDIFEEKFYRNVVVEFAARRDMAKLAVPIFGDQVADVIGQLIKNEKKIEAVYFALESDLTERFRPATLLKSYMRASKKKTTEILKKGDHSASTTVEANSFEINYIRSVVRCVEDSKLEAEFSVDSLKKRLSLLEKAKADKKVSATNSSKPSNKRVYSTGGPSNSGPPPPRPAKMQKFPSRCPTYGQQEAVPRSPALSPVSRYLSPYSIPSQTAYDPGFTASTYGRYSASLVPSADQVAQQQYGVAGGSVPSPRVGPGLVNSYGLQSAYGTYDYGATASLTYQPPYA